MERPDSSHLNRKPRGSKRTDCRHPGKEHSTEEGDTDRHWVKGTVGAVGIEISEAMGMGRRDMLCLY